MYTLTNCHPFRGTPICNLFCALDEPKSAQVVFILPAQSLIHMAKNLVIVESPAKAKTIEGYLGKDFVVKSSMGHIRDLAKGNDSVDIDNDFAPKYVVSPSSKKVVTELKSSPRKPTPCGSRRMRTVKERPSVGTWWKPSASSLSRPNGSCSRRSPSPPF